MIKLVQLVGFTSKNNPFTTKYIDKLSDGHAPSVRCHYNTVNFLKSINKRHSIASPLGRSTVYTKKYAHGFCFAVLCCGYTLTDFPISIRLTSLALWQSNDCPSASKATLMNMDKYFIWINYERLHNHNKAKHNKTVCIFLGIYCMESLLWIQHLIDILPQFLQLL